MAAVASVLNTSLILQTANDRRQLVRGVYLPIDWVRRQICGFLFQDSGHFDYN